MSRSYAANAEILETRRRGPLVPTLVKSCICLAPELHMQARVQVDSELATRTIMIPLGGHVYPKIANSHSQVDDVSRRQYQGHVLP